MRAVIPAKFYNSVTIHFQAIVIIRCEKSRGKTITKKSETDGNLKKARYELFNLLIPSLLEESEQIRRESYQKLKMSDFQHDEKNMEIFSKQLANQLKKLWIRNLREWIRKNPVSIWKNIP